jgi:hypothetical protein
MAFGFQERLGENAELVLGAGHHAGLAVHQDHGFALRNATDAFDLTPIDTAVVIDELGALEALGRNGRLVAVAVDVDIDVRDGSSECGAALGILLHGTSPVCLVLIWADAREHDQSLWPRRHSNVSINFVNSSGFCGYL